MHQSQLNTQPQDPSSGIQRDQEEGDPPPPRSKPTHIRVNHIEGSRNGEPITAVVVR